MSDDETLTEQEGMFRDLAEAFLRRGPEYREAAAHATGCANGIAEAQSHVARIRAEAAAERTRAILEILRRHDMRDCSPGYVADTIEMAFPKPRSSE